MTLRKFVLDNWPHMNTLGNWPPMYVLRQLVPVAINRPISALPGYLELCSLCPNRGEVWQVHH